MQGLSTEKFWLNFETKGDQLTEEWTNYEINWAGKVIELKKNWKSKKVIEDRRW